MGFGWDFGHMRYGESWRYVHSAREVMILTEIRQHRKVFHQYFQQKNVPLHFPVIQKATITLLHQLLNSPDNFQSHIRQ